jgi:hypothetical protein
LSCPGRLLRAHGPRILTYSIGILVSLCLHAPEAPGQDVLYGMSDVDQPGGPDEIVRVDPATGVAVRLHVFATGFNLLESLAYDARENVLWSTNDNALLRIDPKTFATQSVGKIAFQDIDGLAVQPSTGTLFGITYGGNDLIRIDKHDASALLINGNVELGSRLEDLAFDSTGRLYILTSRSLIEVSPSTGARISRVALAGAASLEGLVWDAVRGTFLSAADRGPCKDLVRIDRTTGQVTFQSAAASGFKDIEALAFVPGTPIVPVEMLALEAARDGGGARLAWEARRADLVFAVQRALDPAGPWVDLDAVLEPRSGRTGAWRYEAFDPAAAVGELAGRDLVYRAGAADEAGDWSWIVFEVAAPAPGLVLRPNVPNPFNPTTAFEVRLGQPTAVQVALFDVRGRLVRELDGGRLRAGVHRLVWDGRDASGRSMPAGVYPYRVTAGGHVLRGRAILVK